MAQPVAEFHGTHRFEVLGCLGAGGMGAVYSAFDRELGIRVALKTLHTLRADALLRFKNEFRALQDIIHPNLVSLGELIEEAGQWFFSMELIEGEDFLSFVRPGAAPPRLEPGASPWANTVDNAGTPLEARPDEVLPGRCDERRLRAALGGLARGLAALHRAHKVHRDIKPSNILVTRDERVVLLDFGLVADRGERSGHSGEIVGTTDYMAPEQAASRPAGPEADWYSVGVLVYEALTGRLPFAGGALEVMQKKQKFHPRPPHELEPAVAPDLDLLCIDLLRTDPADRPTALDVFDRLGLEQLSVRTSLTLTSPGYSAPFVGRSAELGELTRAYQAVRAGATVTLCVHGESGVGKSSLVRHFTDGLAGPDGEPPVILQGRCYERESVPYKGVDGVVDAVSRHLTELGPAATELLPPHLPLLAQVFPVLLRTEAVSDAPRPSVERIDPHELRRRVFGALRELLRRIAERRPLVVVIDDLQWADADSLALISDILMPPEAPRLLLVTTVRSRVPGADDAIARLPGEIRHIQLGSLPPDEARRLARALMTTGGASGSPAAAIAEEAGGHPLFIDELVRHLLETGQEPGRLRLEDALAKRIARLTPTVRALLELIAVAGAPIPQAVALQAGGSAGVVANQLALLRATNLVRTSGTRGTDLVESYHDRVREAVIAQIDATLRPGIHRRLALTLEQAPRVDPETLAAHWLGAGDLVRSAHHARVAADRASEAFAFSRAARLYGSCLELRTQLAASDDGGTNPIHLDITDRELKTRLGGALAMCGLGVQAAEVYLDAVQGATAAEALDLKRRAAEQLLRSGHVDLGLVALRTVLKSVGLDMPQIHRRGLASLLLQRARVRLRGLSFHARDPSQIAAEGLTKIDVCWTVAMGLGMVDTIRGADFQARHLTLALDAGEPSRIVRALALEASYAASPGTSSKRRVQRLLEHTDAVAKRLGSPTSIAWAELAHAVTSYLFGDWKPAYEKALRAEAAFRNGPSGAEWEISSAQLFSIWALAAMGELREMARRVPRLLKESEERGDLYAATGQRTGLANLAWLAIGDVAKARQGVREAVRRWSSRGFHFQHYWNLLAQGNIDLYAGDAAASHQRMLERWPALEASMYLRIQTIRVEAMALRARSALGTGDASLLKSVERDARAVGREALPGSSAIGELLRAGLAARRGQPELARAALTRAVAGFEAVHMALYAAAARRQLGELLGGDEGSALIAAADVWMASQRIANPKRMTAMLVSGFGD